MARAKRAVQCKQTSERCERTDERVAQYLRLYSYLIQTTVQSSPAINVRYEHFLPFESFVSRFQSEMMDEATLLRLEQMLYRQQMTPFCRKQVASLVQNVMTLVGRRGSGEEEEENRGPALLKRNLDACMDGIDREMDKKDVSGGGSTVRWFKVLSGFIHSSILFFYAFFFNSFIRSSIHLVVSSLSFVECNICTTTIIVPNHVNSI